MRTLVGDGAQLGPVQKAEPREAVVARQTGVVLPELEG